MKMTTKKCLKRRVISFMTAAAIMTNAFPMGGLSELVHSAFSLSASAADETYSPTRATTYFTAGDIYFDYWTDFYDYCHYFSTDNTFANTHKDDTVILSLTQETSDRTLATTYPGLGNSTYYFNGVVKLPGNDTFSLNTHRAFFSYVTDKVKIINASDSTNITFNLNRVSDVADNKSSPLFADHVKHSTSTTNTHSISDNTYPWKVEASSSCENSYSGVIGTIEQDAVVNLSFVNSSSAGMISNSASDNADIGAVCGKMETGSSLTVTSYSGTANVSITSSAGNAGGLVGKMEGTASINASALPSGYAPVVTANATTEGNGYAGGLAGYVTSQANVTTPSGYSVGGTLVGANGAGGLFGYYLNKNLSASFDITPTDASHAAIYYNKGITATATGTYAGGLFGVFENAVPSSNSDVYSVTFTGNNTTDKHKSGNDSSYNTTGYFGGLVGRYKANKLDDVLLLSNLTLKSESDQSFAAYGGVIGIVDSLAYVKANGVDITAKGTNKRISVNAYFGGLIGATSSNMGVFVDLGNFTLSTSSEDFRGGGVVGQFKNGVLRLSGITNMSSAKPYGTWATNNDNAKIESCYGQLVGNNNNVLVYALGDGKTASASYGNGWRYLRSSGAIADDLGTWGEVVRIVNDGSADKNIESAGIVSVDINDPDNNPDTLDTHVVTLAAAEPSNMSNTYEFAKTALNIMLNQNNTYGGLFNFSSSSQRSTLLAGELSIDADISLAGTGINGFMRDGSSTDISTTSEGDVGVFIGTFNGNAHSITFATGESYGLASDGSELSASAEGKGQIYRHPYVGLFSVIGNGTTAGTVQNLTLCGNITVRNAGPAGMSIGPVAARSHGSTTISGVNSGFKTNDTTKPLNIYYYSGSAGCSTWVDGNMWSKHIGGLIGLIDDNSTSNGTVAVSGTTTINTKFNFSGDLNGNVLVGGAFGNVCSSKSLTVNIATESTDSCTVGIETTLASGITANDADSYLSGLIAYVGRVGSNTGSDKTINIGYAGAESNTVTFADCTVKNSGSATAGGVLGHTWNYMTANIKGVTVNGYAMDNSSTPEVGAMVYAATGKMVVDKLTVSKLTMSQASTASLGMLVNKMYKSYTSNNSTVYDALYLDVLNAGYTLNDKDTEHSTGITLPTTITVYDELAAYSAPTTDKILSGGDGVGVISVNMNSSRSGTSTRISSGTVGGVAVTGTGTYQNKLTSASSSALTTAKFANSNSRYYYNLDKMGTSDGGENLLLWSINKYCDSNINGFFTATASPLSYNSETAVNLTGLSFYPVATADSWTLKNLNITFDYSGIVTSAETIFTAIVNTTDSYVRDPGATGTAQNQHYLMHSGLFINVPAGKTLTLDGEIKISGTFLELEGTSGASDGYSGVLVSQTMKGSLDTKGSITLNGIAAKNPGTTVGTVADYDDGYLLINNIVRDTDQESIPNIYVKNLSASGYGTGVTVAKSLFGAAVGKNLQIEFSHVKLDARSAAMSDSTANSEMTTAYGTSRSIFTDAVFFESIKTNQGAQLIYNYTWTEDWTDSDDADTAVDRYVTYGKEVYGGEGGSLEHPSQENMYSGDKRWYTNPKDNTQLSSQYDFSTGFLKYVSHDYDNSSPDSDGCYYRELTVNVVAEGLTAGCGTYNDPYIITTDSQLEDVANFIKTGKPADLGKIRLPKSKSNFDTLGENTVGNRWCTGDSYHADYEKKDDSTFKLSSNNSTEYEWSNTAVQYYLANAYYKINNDITLSKDFVGLGGETANTAFRGVIVGVRDDNGAPRYTIKNKSDNPFIKVSNGCVVKDVNIVVDAESTRTITLSQYTYAYNNAYFGYKYSDTNACQFYGGIIGEIMGGDNIIDNSYVKYSYTDTNSVTHATIIQLTDDNNSKKYGTLIPVGGYVGVIVFGGLIFKNMTAANTTISSTGLNVTYPYQAGVYKFTLSGTASVEDTFTVAGVTYTVASGDKTTPKEVATKIKNTIGSNNENYSVSSSSEVLTFTEKKGKYGVGVPQFLTTSEGITISDATTTTSPSSGNLAADTTEARAAIYVNPIVGRVINGYAVNETTKFSVDEDGKYQDDNTSTRFNTANNANSDLLHTLKNGTKHYTIADINKNETNKLSFGIKGENNAVTNIVPSSSADGTINIPNAQAFFILSLITQSCAGTATSANGTYATSLSYGTYSSSVYGMSHIADYNHVGSASEQTDSDYVLASKDTAGNTVSTNYSIPYIIYHYTADTNGDKTGDFPARCVTSTSGYYDINLTAKSTYSVNSYTYQLPDSFRGLGSVGNYDSIYPTVKKNNEEGQDITEVYSNRANNKFCLKVDVFNGDACTIDEDIYLNKFQTDNYFNVLHKGTNQSVDQNTQVYEPNTRKNNHGIGLFNSIILNDEDSKISGFTLTGSINTEIYNNSYNTSKNDQIIKGIDNNNMWLSVGGVVGWATNGTCLKFEKIHLSDLSISGSSHIGGIIGFSGLSSRVLKIQISECTANDISLEMTSARKNDAIKAPRQARNAMGGLVGKAYECPVVIFGTSNSEDNKDLSDFSEVKIKSFSFGDSSKNYNVAIGGLVGFAGHCCQIYDMKVSSADSTVTIGNNLVRFSGGIVGGMQSVTQVETEMTAIALFKNCTVENINISGEYAGGFYGGKWDSAWTPYSITFDNCKVLGNEEKNTITASYIYWKDKGSELPCAGGLVGRGLVKTSAAANQSNILIKDCLVSNYTITAVGNGSDATKGVAGGFVGYCSSNANNSTITCYIHDSSVENCVIGASGNYNFGGGAIGWVNPKNANYQNKMLGYNIKLDNVTSNNNDKMGAWVGYLNSTDNTTSIQFSGMAIYGEGFTQNIGNGKTLGTASFVFADYTGASKNFITTTSSSESAAKQEGDENSETEAFTVNSTAKTVTRVVTTVTVGDTETTTETETTVYPYISVSTADPVEDNDLTESINVWTVHEDVGTITYTVSNASNHTITVTTYNMAVSDYNRTSSNSVDMPKYPYVNVNPQSDMGTDKIISSDGAVLYVPSVTDSYINNYSYTDSNSETQYYPSASTMAAKIYADLSDSSNTRRYTTFNMFNVTDEAKIFGNTKIGDYFLRTIETDGDRISTYQNERGELPNGVDDFAVVVIANNETTETTNLINRYIQLVTNTSTDYTDSSDYYSIVVKNCTYSGGKFVTDNITPGLTWTAPVGSTKGTFALSGANADSKRDNTFTLVDVQFKDPFNTNKIAYHLYVPVFTIKQMEVEFYAVATTGTSSVKYKTDKTLDTSDYEALMTNSNKTIHFDGLETWVTQYIRFTYDRDDMNALLDAGKVKWNQEKAVLFDTAVSELADKLPDNTFMVLVDPNGDTDRAYYLDDMTEFDTFTSSLTNRTGWKIELNKFSKGNTNFAVNDFATMLAPLIVPQDKTSTRNGHYNTGGTASNYDAFTVDSMGNKTYYVYATNGDGNWDLELPANTNLNEDYYLSMFVPSTNYNNELYYYTIRNVDTLEKPENKDGASSAKVDLQKSYIMFIADLYTQNTNNKLTLTNDNEQISENNNWIEVDASTHISFRNPQVSMFLSGAELYHSFKFTLTGYSSDGKTTTEIFGRDNITITARYNNSISTPVVDEADDPSELDPQCTNIDIEKNYINVQTSSGSIMQTLRDNGNQGLDIHAKVNITFSNADLVKEFPLGTANSQVGVNVSATSNLAYNSTEEGLAFTSMSSLFTPPDSHYYYRESVDNAHLSYDVSYAFDEFDCDGKESQNYSRLGVNGNRSITPAAMPIITTAKYNVTSINGYENADHVHLTFSLKQKHDNISDGVVTSVQYNPVDLDDYFSGKVTFESGSLFKQEFTLADGMDKIEIDIPQSSCDISDGVYTFTITFNAVTGSGFEKYANYKVDLNAELYYLDNSVSKNYPNSGAGDYLIYTNAKVFTEYIKFNAG